MIELILMMFYVWFRVSFDTQYVLFIVLRYQLILDMFYVTFLRLPSGVFMVIVYKAPVSLASVFKTCYSPNLERADFDRQSFQYTWLNSYFFSSLRESSKTQILGSCDIVRSLLQHLSLSLRYLVSLYTALWYRDSIVTLLIPATTREAVTLLQL